jgi:hypothetical protein
MRWYTFMTSTPVSVTTPVIATRCRTTVSITQHIHPLGRFKLFEQSLSIWLMYETSVLLGYDAPSVEYSDLGVRILLPHWRSVRTKSSAMSCENLKALERSVPLNTAWVYHGSPTETYSFRFSSNLFMNETHPHLPPSTTWAQATRSSRHVSV